MLSSYNKCRQNKDCKTDTPNNLKTAMVKVYKIDKVACLKHMVAEDGLSLSYRSKTEECRRMEALQKRKQRTVRFTSDANAEYGPPDRQCNFQEKIRTGQSALITYLRKLYLCK